MENYTGEYSHTAIATGHDIQSIIIMVQICIVFKHSSDGNDQLPRHSMHELRGLDKRGVLGDIVVYSVVQVGGKRRSYWGYRVLHNFANSFNLKADLNKTVMIEYHPSVKCKCWFQHVGVYTSVIQRLKNTSSKFYKQYGEKLITLKCCLIFF